MTPRRRSGNSGLLVLSYPAARRQPSLSALWPRKPRALRSRAAVRHSRRRGQRRAGPPGPRARPAVSRGSSGRPRRLRRRSTRWWTPTSSAASRVKVLRSDLPWTAATIARFKQEARAIARLATIPHGTDPFRGRERGAGVLRHALPGGPLGRRPAAGRRAAGALTARSPDRGADPRGAPARPRARAGTSRRQAGQHPHRGGHRTAAAGGLRDREVPRWSRAPH